MKRTLMITLVAVATLTGCGGTNSADDQGGSVDPDDTMFAQMMIPHHEQAIELSDIALDPTTGASATVRELATLIKAEQDPEIDQMTAKLAEWGQPVQMDSSMDHSSMMKGMLSADELAALGDRRGTEFDRAWLEAMIAHHEGAIEMADDVLEAGTDSDIRELAESIKSSQRAEIDEMKILIGS